MELAIHRIFIVKLRAPHYTKNTIEHCLSGTWLVKLNLEELELITGWFTKYSSIRDRIQILQEQFSIPYIVVTMGADGAILNAEGTFHEHPGFEVEVADTTGCGDAFLAALVSRLVEGADPQTALKFACALGSLVATFNGGSPDYKPGEITKLINDERMRN